VLKDITMKANGKMIKNTEKVDLYIKMVIIMKETGSKIMLMEKEHTNIIKDRFIQVNGKMIFNMATAKKSGQTVLNTLVIIKKVKRKVMVFLHGQMGQNIKESFKTMKYMVKVNILGQIKESIKANGKITNYMEKADLIGLMVVTLKEIM